MKTSFGVLTPFRQGSASRALDDNVYIAELPRCKPPADTGNLALCKPPPYSAGHSSSFRARLQPTWKERKIPAALPPVPKSTLMTAELNANAERCTKPRTFSGTSVGESKMFSLLKKGCRSAGHVDARAFRFQESSSTKHSKDPEDVPDANETKENNVNVLSNPKPVLVVNNKNISNPAPTDVRRFKDSPRPKMSTPSEVAALPFVLSQHSDSANERKVAFGSSFPCSSYILKSKPGNSFCEQQRPTRSILRSRADTTTFFAKPSNPKTIEKCPDKDLPLKRKEEPMDYLTLHMLARQTRGTQRHKYMKMLASRQGQT